MVNVEIWMKSWGFIGEFSCFICRSLVQNSACAQKLNANLWPQKTRAQHRKRCMLTSLIAFAAQFCCNMSFAAHSNPLSCQLKPIQVKFCGLQQHST